MENEGDGKKQRGQGEGGAQGPNAPGSAKEMHKERLKKLLQGKEPPSKKPGPRPKPVRNPFERDERPAVAKVCQMCLCSTCVSACFGLFPSVFLLPFLRPSSLLFSSLLSLFFSPLFSCQLAAPHNVLLLSESICSRVQKGLRPCRGMSALTGNTRWKQKMEVAILTSTKRCVEPDVRELPPLSKLCSVLLRCFFQADGAAEAWRPHERKSTTQRHFLCSHRAAAMPFPRTPHATPPLNPGLDAPQSTRPAPNPTLSTQQGEGKVSMLCLHGGGHSALSWGAFAKAMHANEPCRIIAYDCRGHGNTTVKPETGAE